MIYSAGWGVRLSVLAVLTGFVNEAKDTAKLYTLVATTDAVAHMIASPLIQYMWSEALQLDGAWLVMPFVVLTVCSFMTNAVRRSPDPNKGSKAIFSCAFLTSCFLQEPPPKYHRMTEGERSSREEDSLLRREGQLDSDEECSEPSMTMVATFERASLLRPGSLLGSAEGP